MNNKMLYSLAALFDSPDKIMKAAKTVADKGYKKFDVNTPYPVHGMDGAMKLPPSKLGYFALVLGLTGATLALLFMWWTTNVDYPNVIGGKPLFALPAFIPITFEVTVLLASVGTVASMIIFFFKFPNNSHPVHDTEYMKKVSSDRYGLLIEADDEKFNEAEIRALYQELGAESIEEIYFDEEETGWKPAVFDKKFIGFLVLLAITVSTIAYFIMNKALFEAPFDWMMTQHKFSAQKPTDFFEDGFSMREPVKGTVAKGFMPYLYTGQPDSAEKYLVNPSFPDDANLELGKERYDIYCSPCHGLYGDGDGRLNNQFPNPPSLHTDKVRNWKDGRIFHIMTEGQNIMPSYAKQITREQRWAIINYVRALQRAKHANEEDVK